MKLESGNFVTGFLNDQRDINLNDGKLETIHILGTGLQAGISFQPSRIS
ncbi:hypothetical protein Lser_V15G16693 [Lactuca serriola]